MAFFSVFCNELQDSSCTVAAAVLAVAMSFKPRIIAGWQWRNSATGKSGWRDGEPLDLWQSQARNIISLRMHLKPLSTMKYNGLKEADKGHKQEWGESLLKLCHNSPEVCIFGLSVCLQSGQKQRKVLSHHFSSSVHSAWVPDQMWPGLQTPRERVSHHGAKGGSCLQLTVTVHNQLIHVLLFHNTTCLLHIMWKIWGWLGKAFIHRVTHAHTACAALNFLKLSYPGKLVKRLVPNIQETRLKPH